METATQEQPTTVPPEAQERRTAFADYLETYLKTHPNKFNYSLPMSINAPEDQPAFNELRNECGTVGCVAGHYFALFHPSAEYGQVPSEPNDEKLVMNFDVMQRAMRYELQLTEAQLNALTVPPYYYLWADITLREEELSELLKPIIHFLRTNDDSGLQGDWTYETWFKTLSRVSGTPVEELKQRHYMRKVRSKPDPKHVNVEPEPAHVKFAREQLQEIIASAPPE